MLVALVIVVLLLTLTRVLLLVLHVLSRPRTVSRKLCAAATRLARALAQTTRQTARLCRRHPARPPARPLACADAHGAARRLLVEGTHGVPAFCA